MLCDLLIMVSFWAGFMSFMKNSSHLFEMLVSLEFLILVIFYFMGLKFSFEFFYLMMMFLIFGVCEGVLGLTILIFMAHMFSGDYINMFHLII